MRPVFVDTSGFYALLVETDQYHARAVTVFERLRTTKPKLVTTSYVLVETHALLQRRVGIEAARDLQFAFVPLVHVAWVDAELHERGFDDLDSRETREISLVDGVSFAVMRAQGIDQAFTFDRDFAAEGFGTLG